jgi:hypothetical protein
MWGVSVPSFTRSAINAMSPESNNSISGFTPASRITFAMRRTFGGVLMTTSLPNVIVLRSSVQISGRSAEICSTRFSGTIRFVPGPAIFGSSSEGAKRPPGPVVMLSTRLVFFLRIRSTTSR